MKNKVDTEAYLIVMLGTPITTAIYTFYLVGCPYILYSWIYLNHLYESSISLSFIFSYLCFSYAFSFHFSS